MPTKHIVLVKFKKDADPAVVQKLKDAVAELPQKIPGISNYSGGDYNYEGPDAEGYTYAISMDFVDNAHRDAYYPHPEHMKVIEILQQVVEKFLPFDYAF